MFLVPAVPHHGRVSTQAARDRPSIAFRCRRSCGRWHEPFHLKLVTRQLSCGTRNLLILAALHDRFSSRTALRRAG